MIDITEVNTKNFQTWPKARRITYHTLVVGCQFLVAVDELMSTTRSYIKLNDEEQVVTWTLPASQLGTRGPTLDISLKCTCIIAGKRLCPYHNMAAILDLTMASSEPGADTDRTLFQQGAQTSTELLSQICLALQDSDTPLTESQSRELIPGGSREILRALGTRFLARLGFSTKLILLLARWDSPTVLQHRGNTGRSPTSGGSTERPGQSPSDPNGRHDGTDTDILELSKQCQGPQPNTAYIVVGIHCHRPDERKDDLPVWEWSAPCGWQHGEAQFMRAHTQRQPILPNLFHNLAGRGHHHWSHQGEPPRQSDS